MSSASRRGRRATRVAVGLLAVAVTVAVWAPFLANDRPLYLHGVDHAEYANAHTTLLAASEALGAGDRSVADLESELGAVRLHAATLARALPGDDSRRDLAAAVATAGERVVTAARAPPGPGSDAEREAARRDLAARVDALREGLAPGAVGALADGTALRRTHSLPALAALSPWDAAALAAWAAAVVVCARLWRRAREPAAREPPARAWDRALVVIVAVGGLVGGVWSVTVGPGPAFDTSPHKRRLTEGTLVARRVVFAPVAMGYAEIHQEEGFRAPTWARDLPDDAPRARVRRGEPGADSIWRHPLGTDGSGRDVLARLIWGTRRSVGVGVFSALLLVAVGTLLGLLGGWYGGRIDGLLTRSTEIVLAFPALLLVLAVLAVADPRSVPPAVTVSLVIGLVGWPSVARLVRAEVLRLARTEFVDAARALGYSTPRILFVHVLPNALGPIVVAFAFAVGGGILAEATIAFLGFGLAEPTASWGAVIAEFEAADHWWLRLFPGLAIAAMVASAHQVGAALRARLATEGVA